MQVRSIREAPLTRRILDRVPWWNLVPDVSHEFVVGGYGTWGQADYATAALVEDGRTAVVYAPDERELTVNLAKLKGRVTARWFDPTTGRSRRAIGSVPANSTSPPLRRYTTPGLNAAGEPDWVLVLDSR